MTFVAGRCLTLGALDSVTVFGAPFEVMPYKEEHFSHLSPSFPTSHAVEVLCGIDLVCES